MNKAVTIRNSGNATILEVHGRITMGGSIPSTQDRVRSVLAQGHKNIILDLAGVTYMDSSGLGELVGSYATVVSQGAEIRLLNLHPKVYNLLQITKLYTVFSIYTDEESAIQSFEPAGVRQ